MAKHSPGPWRWEVRQPRGFAEDFLVDADDNDVFEIDGDFSVSGADSALIAAAPELLEALRSIVDECICCCRHGAGTCKLADARRLLSRLDTPTPGGTRG